MTYLYSGNPKMFSRILQVIVMAAIVAAIVPALGSEKDLFRNKSRTWAKNREWRFENWSSRDVAAFQKTAYPFLKKQCAFCHGDTQAPLFAVSNVNSAYAAAKPLADFADPAKSKLVERAMNGHCGLSLCETDGTELTAAITEWAKSEAPVDVRFRTKQQAIPQLSLDEYRPIQWNLSEMEPAIPGLTEGVLQVEAILFSEDSVLFRRPRIVSNNGPIYVKDLSLELNGEVIQKGKYLTVEKVVMPGTTPPVLSVDKILIPFEEGLQLRVSVAKIQPSAAPVSCNDLERFQSQVYPVMVDRECFYCHGGGPKKYAGEANAMKAFNMTGSVQAVCTASMQRTHQATPLKSPIVWYALGNEAGHPRMIPYVDDIQPEWIDWIKAIKW